MKHKQTSYIRLKALAGRIVLICTLWLAAIAHGPAGHANTVDFDYAAAYTLPDGTLPILCLTGTGEPGDVTSSACDFCRIADSVALAEPCSDSLVAYGLAGDAVHFVPAQTPLITKTYRLNALPRAPPLHV